MPELPEVEIVRRGMARALEGKTLVRVDVTRRDLRVPVPPDFEKTLEGSKIQSLIRRGKYIILQTHHDRCAILHLGMSGRVRIYADAAHYTPQKHDHIVVHASDRTMCVFHDPRRFGMFYTLAPDADWKAAPPFAAMGAEPLENWNGGDLYESLRGRNAPIKSALLDQAIVAGLGNIYVCEALFMSGIHPLAPAGGLSRAQCDLLAQSARRVLESAIKSGGSTLKDYQHTDGTLGYFQNQFAVYGQQGENCPAQGCKQKILRMVQSGRSTFYCPSCQK